MLDETNAIYERGYNDAKLMTAFIVVMQLCYSGALTIRDGAAYLDMDFVDLQEAVRCMDLDDIAIDELPF